jgi:hypothetical protein
MDATRIRETIFALFKPHPENHIRVMSAAELLGVSSGEIAAALDSDLRFHRVPGEGCWDWELYIHRTRSAVPGTRRPRHAPK